MMYSKGQSQTPEMQEQAVRCPCTWENRSRLSLAIFLRQLKQNRQRERDTEREGAGISSLHIRNTTERFNFKPTHHSVCHHSLWIT